jgi:hypothetical protein
MVGSGRKPPITSFVGEGDLVKDNVQPEGEAGMDNRGGGGVLAAFLHSVNSGGGSGAENWAVAGKTSIGRARPGGWKIRIGGRREKGIVPN